MTILIPIISAFMFRSGGVGKDDRFLPFMKPPTWWANKWWRWAMGVPIAIITGNWLYTITYFVATSGCPYGDNSWLQKLFGSWKWLVYGMIMGGASLHPANILWCGIVSSVMKFYDMDQAWWEVSMGFLCTLCFLFK